MGASSSGGPGSRPGCRSQSQRWSNVLTSELSRADGPAHRLDRKDRRLGRPISSGMEPFGIHMGRRMPAEMAAGWPSPSSYWTAYVLDPTFTLEVERGPLVTQRGRPMTRIFNDPAVFKDEMTDGFVSAYSRYVERVPGASGVMRVGGARHGKVSLVIGGGSGHYPAFCGVVGPGLADGAVMGDIFASPSTEQVYRVARALDGGAGVLLSYGNYACDVLNFDAAQERLRGEGVDCRTVLVTDDIASAPMGEKDKRRGVAGDFCVFKVAAAAARCKPCRPSIATPTPRPPLTVGSRSMWRPAPSRSEPRGRFVPLWPR